MTITKEKNNKSGAYYLVKIVGDYNDGDDVITVRKYTEQEFYDALPWFETLLTKCIGEGGSGKNGGKLKDFLESADYDSVIEPLFEHVEVPRFMCEDCHTIRSKDDIKILYFDETGMSYNVTLEVE